MLKIHTAHSHLIAHIRPARAEQIASKVSVYRHKRWKHKAGHYRWSVIVEGVTTFASRRYDKRGLCMREAEQKAKQFKLPIIDKTALSIRGVTK